MLHSLAAHGIAADMVVRLQRRRAERRLLCRRSDARWRAAAGRHLARIAAARRFSDELADGAELPVAPRFPDPHDGIRKLIEDHIPYRNLEDAKLPVHIVTTDIVSGDSVVLSEGSTAEAIVASTAIPGAFAPIRYKDYYLADGAISSNTPIQVAVTEGREAPDHSADRARLRDPGAADRRGRQRAACADAPDRAATGQRARSASDPISSISWCRRYARWWARPTISRERRIISTARF